MIKVQKAEVVEALIKWSLVVIATPHQQGAMIANQNT